MEKIQVHFEHQEKHYKGTLEPVFGSGNNEWHLMIDNFYQGRLRYVIKKGHIGIQWVFDPTTKTESFAGLSEWFGTYITEWMQ